MSRPSASGIRPIDASETEALSGGSATREFPRSLPAVVVREEKSRGWSHIWDRILDRSRGLPRSLRELSYALQVLANLRSLGWSGSVNRGAPMDAAGNPLPWFTYPAIKWLEGQMNGSERVFEFGAGYSTLWFSKMAESVVSVEHGEAWYRQVSGLVGSNVTLLLRPSAGDGVEGSRQSEYWRAIEEYPEDYFDVVVVDGVERVSTMVAAAPRLKDDGILILDNSDRSAYKPGIEFLQQAGFGRIDFWGFIPCCGTHNCTSVFWKTLGRWMSGEVPVGAPNK